MLWSCRLTSTGADSSVRVWSGRSSRRTLSDSILPSFFSESTKGRRTLASGMRKTSCVCSVPVGLALEVRCFHLNACGRCVALDLLRACIHVLGVRPHLRFLQRESLSVSASETITGASSPLAPGPELSSRWRLSES